MSDTKKYSDDSIEKIAEIIGQRLDSKFEAFFEHTDKQNEVVQQNIDALLNKRLTSLTSAVDSLQTDVGLASSALKDTNMELRSLDKAVGNLEHRVHNTQILATSRYQDGAEDRKRIEQIEKQVAKLEAA